MDNESQIFDRPVEAYLGDDNALKVLGSAEAATGVALERPLVPELEHDRKAIADALNSAFQRWDPNKGPEHESSVRKELEKKLNDLSEKAIARLSQEQLVALRSEQKRRLGYGYIFVAKEETLRLDESQRTVLKELDRRARDRAAAAMRDHLSKIQIRNPQAYLAYKISQEIEETRKARQDLGKEFFDKTLSEQQRNELQIEPPSNQD